MLCRLCLVNEPNMKAHILAEGLLKLIHHVDKEYDGRFILVGENLKKPLNRPTGSYDRNILCTKCDNKLGIYDKAAINFCKRQDILPHPSGAAYTLNLSEGDQKKLRLFVISYVWRASITTLNEFKGISLGSKHEEKIRQLLLNGDPGNPQEYAVLVSKFSLPEDKKVWGMHVLNPVSNKLEGVNTVDIYLPNLYKLILKVDQRPFGEIFSKSVVGETKEILIFDREDYRESDEFKIMHSAITGRKRSR